MAILTRLFHPRATGSIVSYSGDGVSVVVQIAPGAQLVNGAYVVISGTADIDGAYLIFAAEAETFTISKSFGGVGVGGTWTRLS